MSNASSPVERRAHPRRIAIAIDGPAASGKSSTAQWVAQKVGFRHVDSGALYRAATAARLRRGGSPEQWTAAEVLEAASIVTVVPRETSFAPLLGGVEVDDEIRGSDVTRCVSHVARMPEVRAWVDAQVRALAATHDVVVDGRDIGTTVLPGATCKVFLVADPWERARRRLVQRVGHRPSEDEIAEETDRIVRRDARDATQTAQAREAVLIDTTFLTQEEQVDRIVALVRAALHRREKEADVAVDEEHQGG